MAQGSSPVRKPAGRRCALCGCAVLVIFLAGCAERPKDTKAKPTSPPPAAEKPHPAKVAQPAVVSENPAAIAAKAKTARAAEASLANKEEAPKPSGEDGLKQGGYEPGQEGRLSSQTERDALVELIKAQALAAQKSAEQKSAQPAAGPVTAPTAAKADQLATAAKAPAAPQPAAATQPGAAKPGCGPSSDQRVDVTPPPPDQPQPKFVAKQTKIKAPDVWAGKQATFVWELVNEGQGPLAIRLQGG